MHLSWLITKIIVRCMVSKTFPPPSKKKETWNLCSVLPGVHPAINDRVVHGIRHGEPVDGQVHFLDVVGVGDLRHERRQNEVHVKWQPANGKY